MGGKTLDQFNSRQKAKAKDLKGASKEDALSSVPDQQNTRDKERN